MRALVMTLLLAGCASTQAISEYSGPGQAVNVDGRKFIIRHHPEDQAVLVQASWGATIGGALLDGFTLGTIDASEVAGAPRATLERAAMPLIPDECSPQYVDQLSDVDYQVVYACPE